MLPPSTTISCFFSEAIFILLMECITPAQIDHAEKLLWNFCSQMSGLYSERYMTANIHLLVRLSDSIRALGPLWTHSCFHFKDKNGHLLRIIHGTQNIPVQLVNAVKIIQSLPCIKQNMKLSTATAAKLTSEPSYLKHSVVENVKMIGVSLHFCLKANDKSLVEQFLGQEIQYDDVKTYNRAQVRKTVYTSKQYVKAI